MFLKKLMLIKEMNEKSVIFVTIGIFLKKWDIIKYIKYTCFLTVYKNE